MSGLPETPKDTFLTARQIEVLSMRQDGMTLQEVADELGTSVANISAIEQAGRRNIETARRTISLAKLLTAAVRFRATAGTDLRELIDEIYKHADNANLKISYTEPELSSHLQNRLGNKLEGRQVTSEVDIGITIDGDVETYTVPSSSVAE